MNPGCSCTAAAYLGVAEAACGAERGPARLVHGVAGCEGPRVGLLLKTISQLVRRGLWW